MTSSTNFSGPVKVQGRYVVTLSADGSSLVDGGGNVIAVFLRPSGDTSGATDRAALQALHDSLPAAGGKIQLTAGVFYLDSAVTYTKPVTTIGAGGMLAGNGATLPSYAATTVYCLSATANGFVAVSGCVFSDFALVNSNAGTPSAGAGIYSTLSHGILIDRMTILGFYDNLSITGDYWHCTNNNIYDEVRYGLYISNKSGDTYLNDHGDMVIANNIFSGWSKTRTSSARLRYESMGGMKIIGNKFNSGGQPGNASAGVADYCIDVQIADGVTTSSLNIEGNSISGWASSAGGIRIGQLGTTGKIINTTIVGNEITIGTNGLKFGGASAAADYISNLECSGNIFSYFSGAGIVLFNCREVHIGTNEWRLCSSPFIHIGASPDTGSGVIGIKVDPQATGQHDAIDIIQDDRKFSNGFFATGSGVEYDYTRGMYITANAVWQTAGVLTIANGAAVVLELDLDGQNGNAGHNSGNNRGVAIRQTRSFDVNTSGVVTAATIGTDVAAGAGAAYVAVQYVLGTNTVTIQVQTTDGTQLSLWAGARMRVNGKLTKFRLGA